MLELLPLAADGFPAFPHVVDISVTDKHADVGHLMSGWMHELRLRRMYINIEQNFW